MNKHKLATHLLVLLRRIWGHLSTRRRSQLLLLLALMVMVSVLEVFSIGSVVPFLGALTSPEYVYAHPAAQDFISIFSIQSPSHLLLPLTAMFMVAAIAAGVSRLLLLWATLRISYAIGGDIGFSILKNTLHQPYGIHIARNSSEVIHVIAVKAPSVVSEVIQPMLIILSSAFMLSLVAAGLLYFEPAVAISAIATFVIIYGLIMWVTRWRLMRDSLVIAQEGAKVIRFLQEGLGAIRDILIDGSQHVYCSMYQDSNRRLFLAQGRLRFFGQSPRFVIEALGMVLIALLAYNLSAQENGIAVTLPILGALAISAQRLMPVLQQAYAAWVAIQGSRESLQDVLTFLDQPMLSEAETQVPPLPFNHSIVLRDVRFRYDAGNKWVLNGINLQILKGQRVGFIGVTGSGKSTLLDIVMALLSPTEGAIEVDGILVTDLNRRAWQRHLAHVPQSIYLSDGAVDSNIALGVSLNAIDDIAVRDAAKRARISELIESLPKKYKTAVGERGVRLSGGQRQRIGIARALYKKADVIVFDEATSALDSETEAEVLKEIEGLDKDLTVFIIAHRLSTLKNCSLIVQLDDGHIGKTGTYEEVVQS